MKDRIKIKFDKIINGYVVSMPDFVTFDMIQEWKDQFDKELKAIRVFKNFVLLVDTNQHHFESIQCLKSLRDYFTDNTIIKSNFSRIAFVSPARFIEPTIKSEIEAYFDNFEQAYQWLEE